MEYSKLVIGKKCYLTPLELADADKVAKWQNDLRVQMNFDLVFTLTADDIRYYLPEAKKTSRIFGIVDKETEKLIGVTGLHDIDHISRHAMFSIYVGEQEYRASGFGTEAVKLTLDFGFNMLNLHNIALFVIQFNKSAIKVYENCGFKHAGIKRQSKILGNEKFDMLMMDILAEEFKSIYVKQVLKDIKK